MKHPFFSRIFLLFFSLSFNFSSSYAQAIFQNEPRLPDNAKQSRDILLVSTAPGKEWIKISPDLFPPVWMEARPWWRHKENAKQKIQDQRTVLVSVVTEPLPREHQGQTGGLLAKQQLRFSGACWVSSSASFMFRHLRELERLKEWSSYIKESNFDPSRKNLFLRVSAFGIEIPLKLEVLFREFDKASFHLFFHVVEGALKGMKGSAGVKEIEHSQSELFIVGFYDYNQLPMPSLILQFGMEMVLKQLAERIRTTVESLYSPKKV